MKAILTRIRRMEHRVVPAEDSKSRLVANLLRERRRRRCDASGEPFEVASTASLSTARHMSHRCRNIATAQDRCA